MGGDHPTGPRPASEPPVEPQPGAGAQPGEHGPDAQQPGGDQSQQAGLPKKTRGSGWRELLIALAAALVLTLVLKAFVVEIFSIPSQSMENTLLPGERVVVNKLVYHFRGVARGDIVVFNGAGSWDPPEPAPGNPASRLVRDVLTEFGLESDGTIYIKRVIGLPGDRVACCDAQGLVTVNGVPLAEQSYLFPGDRPSQTRFSVTVPPGRLWVMGDNRSDSADSRYHRDAPGQGTIPASAVVGRAFAIVWPLSRIQDLPIPATFGQPALHPAALPMAATVAPAVALPLPGIVRARRRRTRGVSSHSSWRSRKIRRIRRDSSVLFAPFSEIALERVTVWPWGAETGRSEKFLTAVAVHRTALPGNTAIPSHGK